MAIKVKIGNYSPAERENEFVSVVDALLADTEHVNPSATFEVENEKVGSTKRLMREAAHLRGKTARLVSDSEAGGGKSRELTYVLIERITRDNTETA